MSFKEIIFFRLPQQFQYLIKGRIHQNINFNKKHISINNAFLRPQYSKESLKLIIPEHIKISEYNFFSTLINLDDGELSWLKDFKNDIKSSPKYYADIDRQEFDKIGDVKFICEPSRFHFLPFLSLYHGLNNDRYSIKIIEKTINDWNNQNPYLNTVHWTSGIEVGIRSVNLIYTHLVLSSFNILSEKTDLLIKDIIKKSYHFLKNHLSLYSSANNHLVAELAGLTAISHYFENPEYTKSRKKWTKKIFDQVLRQINGDGVNMELSTHYHAEVTDHFFNALKFIKSSGGVIPKNVENRLKLAFEFINHVEYQGNKTIFGDNDEGYLLYPYYQENFSIYKSLLMSSDIEYKTNYSKKVEFDLRNYLIFGDKKKSNLNYKLKEKEDKIFEKSGYAFFYNNTNNTKLSFDFGKIGDEISAAHGHSDILHFMLETKGIPIVIDPGTYQYHKRHQSWRSYFRGISAHNTISINHSDHAKAISRMSWVNQPQVSLLNYNINKNSSEIKAQHNAFDRFGVIHTRSMVFNKLEKFIIINDNISCDSKKTKPNELSFYLNFNPDLEVEHNNNTLNISNKSVSILVENELFKEGRLIRGQEKSKLGWFSKGYNELEPGIAFMFNKKITKPLLITTKIFL